MDERLGLSTVARVNKARLCRGLEGALEIPMLILGVMMIPLLLAPYLFELAPEWVLVLEIPLCS